MDKNLFLKNMEEMIQIAKTNGNQIDHKELLDYFSDYELNEEAKKLLIASFVEAGIRVLGVDEAQIVAEEEAKEKADISEEEQGAIRFYEEELEQMDLPGEEEQKELAGRIDYPVRKCAHAAEYMVLAIWVFLTVSSFRKKSKGVFIPAWLITTAYAATDEIHQLFVPGRSGRATDVCIDAAGALVGIFFCFLVSLIRRKIWNRKK